MSPKARAVIFLHCYTSELNKGGERLREIIRGQRVLLIDMGHTHSNELANDGHTLYSTTRSTGQIEEGPVGFSVTNVDGDVVGWKYLPLVADLLLIVISPADCRLVTVGTTPVGKDTPLTLRAKLWDCPLQ